MNIFVSTLKNTPNGGGQIREPTPVQVTPQGFLSFVGGQ